MSEQKTKLKDAYRIIDANINRAKEGLRVCEETMRFYYKNLGLTENISDLRHAITYTIKKSKVDRFLMIQERNSQDDIGKNFCFGPSRKSVEGIFLSNVQRTKEALRVLEEFLKLFDVTTSKKIQKLRFDAYTLEKKIIKKYPSILNSR